MSSERFPAWADRATILDTWIDRRRSRIVSLYALLPPLDQEGYVAVTTRADGTPLRSMTFLKKGEDVASLRPGDEARSLKARSRALRHKRKHGARGFVTHDAV